MNVIRICARELSGADGVTFVLREGDNCHYAEENAISPLWKGRRFPLKTCISGWVMLNKQPAVIEDIFSDPRIPLDAYRPTFVKSLVMVPVRASDPLAAIGAYWAQRRQPQPQEIALLQALADTTATALANVQLYESLQTALASEKDARRQAESANRAKDEFLAVLSHELRTPLTPVAGWLRLLQQREWDEQTKHALSVIDRNVQAEIRLVEDLLDLSYIVSGKLNINPAPLRLNTVIADALETVRPLATAKRIVIEAQIDNGARVDADYERLQQAILNVLNNAVKFTPAGGMIRVTLCQKDDQAEIEVRDNGEGVEPEFVPMLFKRFSQSDSSSTRRHGGLGLGLSIAHHIIDLHGGSVNATSPGKNLGATFILRLPLATRQHSSSLLPKVAVEPDSLAGIRVLVVEDEPDALDFLLTILRREAALATGAASTAEALKKIALERPDVIVTDLGMPGEDGYTLLKKLRSHSDTAHIPAIALTAFAATEDRSSAMSAGFQAYMSKPFNAQELIERIGLVARKK
jgi:signal transduction histidine kinase/CheY-like chemotaxis protein